MARGALIALLLLGPALVGCLGDQVADPPDAEEPGAQAPEQPGVLERFANVSSDRAASEPVVDVGPNGTLYLQGKGYAPEETAQGFVRASLFGQAVWRSTDRGQTWTNVSPPRTGNWSSGDGFVSVDDGGTVYVANAYGRFLQAPTGSYATATRTFELFRSEDKGDSWEKLAPPQVGDQIHRMWIQHGDGGTLHLTLAAKDRIPQGTSGAEAQPLWYLRSDDAGDTWQPPVLLDETRSIGTDLALAPDGTLAIAVWTPANEQDWTLLRSTDGGSTWESSPAGPDGTDEGFASSWQALEAGPDGELHLAWAQKIDGRVQARYISSTDGGETWTEPRPLLDIEGEQLLPWIVQRGPGVLGVGWYGTSGDPANGSSRWRAHVAVVTNATGTPTVEQHAISPRLVHEGQLCVSGTCAGEAAEGNGTNPLQDFSWITEGPQGGLHAAFASSQWDGIGAFPVYAAPGFASG